MTHQHVLHGKSVLGRDEEGCETSFPTSGSDLAADFTLSILRAPFFRLECFEMIFFCCPVSAFVA